MFFVESRMQRNDRNIHFISPICFKTHKNDGEDKHKQYTQNCYLGLCFLVGCCIYYKANWGSIEKHF